MGTQGEARGELDSFTKVLRWRAVLYLGVQIEYDVVHLRTSLVQLFALLFHVVKIIEIRRFGGAPNGYHFAALAILLLCKTWLVVALAILVCLASRSDIFCHLLQGTYSIKVGRHACLASIWIRKTRIQAFVDVSVIKV
jgi:hypothetical protein